MRGSSYENTAAFLKKLKEDDSLNFSSCIFNNTLSKLIAAERKNAYGSSTQRINKIYDDVIAESLLKYSDGAKE